MIFRPPHLKLLIVLIICILPIAAWGQQITFTYNPPDGSCAISKSSIIDTTTFFGGRRVTKRIFQAKEVNRRMDSNVFLISTILNSEKYIDDEKQDESELDHVIGLPLTYIVDFDGRLDSLAGYEAFRDSIIINQSTEISEYFPQYYDYWPFFIATSQEWNNQTGDFAGKTVKIGDTLILVDTIENLVCTQYIRKTIRFADLIKYGGEECLLIEFEYSIDKDYSEIFSNAFNAFLTKSALYNLDSKAKILEGHVATIGREILDPKTMMIYYRHRESIELTRYQMYGSSIANTQVKRVEENKSEFIPANK